VFSGIVDHCGEITELKYSNNKMLLWINSQFKNFELGESIAVDGMCLTVIDFKDQQFAVEVSPESLRITAAKQYQLGQLVNLAKAMRLNERIGGHLVSGHIDATLQVATINQHNEFKEIIFAGITEKQQHYLIPKGSVAIQGVSLTVNTIQQNQLSVMLIPHTLQRTNLDALKKGDLVNIEFDQIAKQVARCLVLQQTAKLNVTTQT
jgi:riboflavin synthase